MSSLLNALFSRTCSASAVSALRLVVPAFKLLAPPQRIRLMNQSQQGVVSEPTPIQIPTPKEPKELRTQTASTKVTDSESSRTGCLCVSPPADISEWIRQTLSTRSEPATKTEWTSTFSPELVGIQLLLMNTLGPLIRGERMTPEYLDAVLKQVQSKGFRTPCEKRG